MVGQLGILQGKKGQYNELIVKSLFAGPKTTKQIAEYIFDNREEKEILKARPNRGNEVRKIYSIIDRKGGRLAELSEKKYITRSPNLSWDLTYKGTCVALTLYGELEEVMQYVPLDQFSSELVRIIESTKKHPNPVIAAYVKTVEFKDGMKEVMNRLANDSAQFTKPIVEKIRDVTKDNISKGVDIDSMTNDQYKTLMAVTMFSWLWGFIGVKGDK